MNALIDHQAERALIGEMLQYPECSRHLSELSPEDFDEPQAAAAFAGMASLKAQKATIDIITLPAEVKRLSQMDVTTYLMECAMTGVTGVASAGHAKIVQDTSRRRKLYKTLRGEADKLIDIRNDTDEITQSVGTAIKGASARNTLVSFRDSVGEAFDAMEYAAKLRQTGESPAIRTGIPLLDNITGGLWPGQNTVLAASTGAGKSAFAMEIAFNAAMKSKRVMICSAEMTRLQYTQRIMARLTGIPLDHIINGDIGDQQWQLVGDMASEIAKMNDGFLTDTYAIETLQSIVDANPPDLLIVDYLQLLDTKRRTENENIRLGVISTTIKRMAVSNNIPVLSLSQLSRQEGRAAVMPILKDLRGSGSIEQDADTVIFLHNPEAPSDKSVRDNDKDMCRLCLDSAGKPGEKRYIVVNVAKQRQGRRLAMFPLIFEPEVMRFTQIDRRGQ